MIGAGIFVLPSSAAGNAGPASAVSFAIGGFVSLLAALSLSELATGMPEAGGSYYYATVAIVRGVREEPRTVAEALVERLTGG